MWNKTKNCFPCTTQGHSMWSHLSTHNMGFSIFREYIICFKHYKYYMLERWHQESPWSGFINVELVYDVWSDCLWCWLQTRSCHKLDVTAHEHGIECKWNSIQSQEVKKATNFWHFFHIIFPTVFLFMSDRKHANDVDRPPCLLILKSPLINQASLRSHVYWIIQN